jgi:hypothetical protein
MMAVVNNSIRSRGLLQEMKDSVAEKLPPESNDVRLLDKHFQDISEEFHKLALTTLDVLKTVVFRDLNEKGLFPELFKPDW